MSENIQPDLKRRSLLGGMAAGAGVTLAPGVVVYSLAEAKPLDQAVSSKNRWGMLIDSNKCKADCDHCVVACNDENGLEDLGRPTTDAKWIRKVELKNTLTQSVHSLPMMCQHCESAPCVDVCPTGASFKREDGIVLVDRHTCIGCRYCMMACPYKARSFSHEVHTNQKVHNPRGKGCVEGCTMCVHRVDAGESPACVEACAEKGPEAMIFGDLNDPKSEISMVVKKYATTQIRADLGLNPSVRYQGI